MKVDPKILHKYLRKVSLGGNIMTLNMNFAEDGMHTKVQEAGNLAMVEGVLNKDAFEEYESIGEIYIKNSKFLLEMLKTFNEVITIAKEEDHIIKLFTDRREAYLLLADKSICDNISENDLPVIATTVSVDLTKTDMEQIIKDMRLLEINMVNIVKEGNKLTFQIGEKNEYDFTKNIVDCEGEGEASVGIGNTIVSFLDAVSDKFTLKLGTNLPLVLVEETPVMKVTTMIAPIVNEK